jgi:hypothetical protein
MKTLLLCLLLIALWPIGYYAHLDETALARIPENKAPVQRQAGQVQAGEEVFTDTTVFAKIEAIHDGAWSEFDASTPFTGGYIAAGQAWGDYNNDGLVDLYVTGNLAENTLYHNNGNGTFVVPRSAVGVSLPDVVSGGAVWADYDNDGWRDLYVLAHGANVLFRNEGGVEFTDVTGAAGVGDPGKGTTAAWGDYDQDGFLDLYVANWSCFPECDPVDPELARDTLYRNNGDDTFRDVSDQLPFDRLLGAGFSASFLDYDDDGDLDIYVVNDQRFSAIGNVLFRNDGFGCDGWCWTDASADANVGITMNGGGLGVADFNNDRRLDMYAANRPAPMALFQNQGDGAFAEVAGSFGAAIDEAGVAGWGNAFLDYDNDGWQDIVMATTEMRPDEGFLFEAPNRLLHNNGDGSFADVTPTSWGDAPTPSIGLATADFDNDGLVDFVTGDWDVGYRLYRNEGSAGAGNNWLTVRLVGGGPVNRDAVGARVYVTTIDDHTQMQEVKIGSSVGSGNDTALHFGLGQASDIRDVTIVWPNRFEHHFSDAPVNQVWQIVYPAVGTGLPQLNISAVVLIIVLVILALFLVSWKQFVRPGGDLY